MDCVPSDCDPINPLSWSCRGQVLCHKENSNLGKDPDSSAMSTGCHMLLYHSKTGKIKSQTSQLPSKNTAEEGRLTRQGLSERNHLMYIYYTHAIYMKCTCNIDVRYIHEKYVKHTHTRKCYGPRERAIQDKPSFWPLSSMMENLNECFWFCPRWWQHRPLLRIIPSTEIFRLFCMHDVLS